MPELPTARVTTLEAAGSGSLLSLKNPISSQIVFGFRVSVPLNGKPEPAFVQLAPLDNGGFAAELVPISSPVPKWIVNRNTAVVSHGDKWSMHVAAQDWDGDLKFRNFAVEDTGLLLLSQGGEPAMAVRSSIGCSHLSLTSWSVEQPPSGRNYVAARIWRLSLPGAGRDVEWPFGAAGATP
jgi:hypothetical protein